jgi:putative endonuclease
MKALGNKGEEIAAKYLKKKGYKILKRNYAAPSGEIDIVARDGGTVVFVEVKARTDDRFGLPAEAVGSKKQQKLRSVALHYLQKLRKQPPARFDIVSVYVKDGGEEIEHIRDAFETGALE